MERNRGIVVSVTSGIRNRIRPHGTRVVPKPRTKMRVLESVFLAVLLTWNGCTQIPKTERKTIPIIDKGGTIHLYRSSHPLELGNDYALYCMEHHCWETISVRYIPTTLSKLRSEEYTVRKHPKSS